MIITKKSYGRLEDGQAIDLFTLTNSNGIEVMIINYGGIIKPSAWNPKIFRRLPITLLNPGEIFRSKTIYKFSVEK